MLHAIYVARRSRVTKTKIIYGDISKGFMRNIKWSNVIFVAKSLGNRTSRPTSRIFMRNGNFHVSFAATRLKAALISSSTSARATLE